MKKKIKLLGINTGIVLMTMVFFGSLFSSCYTKDDIPVEPVVPTSPGGHNVSVTVYDAIEGKDLTKEAKVNGKPATDVISKEWGGLLQLTITCDDYETAYYTISLPLLEAGQTLNSSASFALYPAKSKVAPTYDLVIKACDAAGAPIADADTKMKLIFGELEMSPKDGGVFTIGTDILEKYAGQTCSFLVTCENYQAATFMLTIPKLEDGEKFKMDYIVRMFKNEETPTAVFSGMLYDFETQRPISANGEVIYYLDGELNKTPITSGFYQITDLAKNTKISLLFDVEGYQSTLIPLTVTDAQNVNFYVKETTPEGKKEVSENAVAFISGDAVSMVVPATKKPEGDEAYKFVQINSSIEIEEGTTMKQGLDDVYLAAVSSKVNGQLTTAPMQDNLVPAAAFVSSVFGPSGLEFSTPISWIVKNPFGNVEFNCVKLQYSEDGMVWKPADEAAVSVSNGVMTGKIKHFSNYRMTVQPEYTKVAVDSTVETLSFYSANGEAISNPKFTYTNETGVEEFTIPSYSPSVETVISYAMASIGLKEDSYTTTNETYTLKNVTVKGNEMLTIRKVVTKYKYTFTFALTNGSSIEASCYEYKTKLDSPEVLVRDPHHTHGGHITEGGAGGGAGSSNM